MVCVTTKISQKNRYSRLLFSLVTWAILPVWIIVFDRRSLQSKDGGKKWRLFSPSLSLWSANWYSAHDLMLLLAWPQDMIARIPVRQGVVDRVNKTQGDEHFISPPFYCLNGHCQAVESPIIGGFTTPGEEANLVIPNFPCWPGKKEIAKVVLCPNANGCKRVLFKWENALVWTCLQSIFLLDIQKTAKPRYFNGRLRIFFQFEMKVSFCETRVSLSLSQRRGHPRQCLLKFKSRFC